MVGLCLQGVCVKKTIPSDVKDEFFQQYKQRHKQLLQQREGAAKEYLTLFFPRDYVDTLSKDYLYSVKFLEAKDVISTAYLCEKQYLNLVNSPHVDNAKMPSTLRYFIYNKALYCLNLVMEGISSDTVHSSHLIKRAQWMNTLLEEGDKLKISHSACAKFFQDAVLSLDQANKNLMDVNLNDYDRLKERIIQEATKLHKIRNKFI